MRRKFDNRNENESRQMTVQKLEKIREEMADVLLYLVRLADKLDIDLVDAAVQKIKINGQKYPVDKALGSSKKYTDLQ